MSTENESEPLALSLLTLLLGKSESTSFDNGLYPNPPWFSSDLPFCLSISASENKSYTFSQLKQYVKHFASGLRKAGIQDGNRLMVFAPDTLNIPLMMLATWAAGGIFVSRGVDSTAEQQAQFIRHAQPKIVLAYRGYEQTVSQAVQGSEENGISIYSFSNLRPGASNIIESKNGIEDWNVLLDETDGPNFQWPNSLSPEEMKATILIEYTSGTTSDPKGVEHTNSSIPNWLTSFDPNVTATQQRRLYSDFPFSQIASKVLFLDTLKARNMIIIPEERLALPALLDSLAQHKPQVAAVVKRTVDALASCDTSPDLSFLEGVVTTAQIFPKKTRAAINAVCGHRNIFFINYGATEGGSFSRTYPGQPPQESSCQGKITKGVEAKVADDQGNNLPAGEQGRLLFRSAAMMKQYWRDPELSAKTIDGEGYLDSGDLGYIDEETGQLHVTGRTKEIIKVQGRSVSPNAIEEVLVKLDWVAVAVVVMVQRRDDGEELPTAFVVRGHAKVAEDGDEEQLFALVRQELNVYHRLTGGVIFLPSEDVPYGGNGKIMRRSLRDRAQVLWDKGKLERR